MCIAKQQPPPPPKGETWNNLKKQLLLFQLDIYERENTKPRFSEGFHCDVYCAGAYDVVV
jgi:hypothetical protein